MRVAGLAVFVKDLDELHLRELLEVFDKRLGDIVQRAVRLTGAGEIDLGDAIGEHDTLVAGKAVEHEGQPLIAFDRVGTGKEFIHNSAKQIFAGGHEAGGGHFIG